MYDENAIQARQLSDNIFKIQTFLKIKQRISREGKEIAVKSSAKSKERDAICFFDINSDANMMMINSVLKAMTKSFSECSCTH